MKPYRSFWVVLLSCLGTMVLAQQTQIHFEHLDDQDGLSHNRVTSILEDDLGFMWFGSLSGLNRYDGTEVKVIQMDEKDPFSLKSPNIVWIKEGPDKCLWIKSTFGISVYDVYREKFIDASSLLNRLGNNSYNLTDIEKDTDGHFWFLVDGEGLSKYDDELDTVYHVTSGDRQETSIVLDEAGDLAVFHNNGLIRTIDVKSRQAKRTVSSPELMRNKEGLTALITSEGNYWLYGSTSSTGACYFEPLTGEYRYFGETELGATIVSGIVEDAYGDIVIGVDHYGISIVSGMDWSITRYMHNPMNSKSLNHNSIVSIYSDRSGRIWIGTNKGGVNYYLPKSAEFSIYKQTGSGLPNENDVLRIVETEDHNLWIGTDGAGLVYFDRSTSHFTSMSRKTTRDNHVSSNIIVSMISDRRGGLWIGTYMGGLNHFDGQEFEVFKHEEGNDDSPCDNSIWRLYMDSKDNLWVGTLKSGIDVYNSNFEKIVHLDEGNVGLSSNHITAITEDEFGRMWIGTGYGVDIYDPKAETIVYLRNEENNRSSLTNNSVVEILMDEGDDVWVATMYGVNRISKSTGKITRFTKSDGLPHNFITSLVKDPSGDLWLGTYQGISRLRLSSDGTANFDNFDAADGLQSNIFNERASILLSSGELVFGGKNGINIFDPKTIEVVPEKETLVFLDFYLSNKRIKPGEVYNDHVWFEKGINATRSLTLEHHENSFSIGFTALNFSQQGKIIYRYRLKGFDTNWVSYDDLRSANYTNLDPGKYRFEVEASELAHPESATRIYMDIEILTPFWKTPWAYTVYGVLVLLTFCFLRKMILQKERYRTRLQQERMESERMHELDMMKLKFFTNISHEFRTPLSLILTPVERLMGRLEGRSESKDLHLVHRNAKRLLTLVSQLLDFRKMETDQHHLSCSSGDLVLFLKDIINDFSDLSTDRKIDLEFNTAIDELFVLFDRDKLEKVVFNLLSNAFKFTPEHGRILVTIVETGRHEEDINVRISVKDTGLGISLENQDSIFKRFFQVERGDAAHLNHGSGIGLAITKEFVEMHNGQIEVVSKPGEGSEFVVNLSLKSLKIPVLDESEQQEEMVFDSVNDGSERATVLVVDDNMDFRFYLAENLRVQFRVLVAANGKTAWKKAMEHKVDLIVTDIMMPEMNGIDLCRKVKKDPRTAHTPVILLSARYSDDQKVEGYEAGASEYITKPFNFDILLRSIQSSLQLHKLIHASEHRKESEPTPTKIEIVPLDEQLIKKALEIVERNISNSDFSVQALSHDLGVSRGQLYKKILEITGKTPIEFIRLIRLKRAAELLQKSQLTVAEVAYKVGFNNPKYFTKYFRSEFKTVPSKYSDTFRSQEHL